MAITVTDAAPGGHHDRASVAQLGYYATPGPMTRLPSGSPLLTGLPELAVPLCRVSNTVIVHEFWADQYGVDDVAERVEELENRAVIDMLARLEQIDARPLTAGREPRQRLLGNCRHFSVLTCALLRGVGIPARARAGFAGYFDDTWVDHWIVERWDTEANRWVRTDPQLDQLQQRVLGFDFDPLELPDDAFLTGSEAWLRCRSGQDDPARFGIMDMRGLWFVAGNVIRDLAALHKIELLPWDDWGLLDETIGDQEDARTALLDDVAAAVVDGAADRLRALYERPELHVPSVVRSARFERDVAIDIDVDIDVDKASDVAGTAS